MLFSTSQFCFVGRAIDQAFFPYVQRLMLRNDGDNALQPLTSNLAERIRVARRYCTASPSLYMVFNALRMRAHGCVIAGERDWTTSSTTGDRGIR